MRISDEQARELWRRAAELQASAERSPQRSLPLEPNGLSLHQVAVAAEGAGIDPDYVRIAVAEKQLPDADCIDPDLWTARWLRALLREADTIELSRIVNAPPAVVHTALRSVTSRPSYDLVLESTIGEDPLNDAVLVYRITNNTSTFQDDMNWTDARVLLFTIRDENEQTRLRVRVPLYRRGINLGLIGGISTGAGFTGMSIGGGIAGSLPAALAASASLAVLPVALGGLAGLAAGIAIYRGLYRWTYKGGVAAVTQLLTAITTEAETTHQSEY